MKSYLGALIGVIVGYPVSYMFQGELLKAKCSFPDYFTHIGDVFQTIGGEMSSIGWTAVITMVVCGVIGFVIPKFLARKG